METKFKVGNKLQYTYLRQMMNPGFKEVEVVNVVQGELEGQVTLHYSLKSLETNEVITWAHGFVENAFKLKD